MFSDKKESNRLDNDNININSSVHLESNLEHENSKIDITNNKNVNNNKKANGNNIRGKYKKTKDKSEFLKNIQYLMIKNYSISNYNKSSNSAYYY